MSFKRLVCKIRGHQLDNVEAQNTWQSPNRRLCGRCGCMLEKKQLQSWEYAGQTWCRYEWVEVTREQLVAETLMKEEGVSGGRQGQSGWQGVVGPIGWQGATGVQGCQGFQGTAGTFTVPKGTGAVVITAYGAGGSGGSHSVNKSDTVPGLVLTPNEIRATAGLGPVRSP